MRKRSFNGVNLRFFTTGVARGNEKNKTKKLCIQLVSTMPVYPR
jgi:hypothetical protein